ncbi:membrane protein insertion efficiency factor YidD [Helicobacter sp. 11S02596-1]|uniref:membrane protein insertion efficiency factor YidD n=1 Tax=Helicobacter sp. 11S02596-1 TaxID=1476194 RepID=UPI000BA5E130|nr:membrane protein insertion efficiency factor YidD [Helicobacter sp. 11S02596-1]PAF44492.1 membrane protein insertion efficiency factor YidD [Helicobacter sp. 11S02596-1]
MRKNFLYFCIFFVFQNLILAYQKFISPMLPNRCRYYPTCSEYALWTLRFNNPFRAIYRIGTRILRCNQFFEGGIDYPIGYGVLEVGFSSPQKMMFWLVPLGGFRSAKTKFYIIKSLSQEV